MSNAKVSKSVLHPPCTSALMTIVITGKQLKPGNMCATLPASGQANANIMLSTLPCLLHHTLGLAAWTAQDSCCKAAAINQSASIEMLVRNASSALYIQQHFACCLNWP
ncbi:TPA: hypothetical protein ACH3X3_014043 [Trebouxia sp. C0006]